MTIDKAAIKPNEHSDACIALPWRSRFEAQPQLTIDNYNVKAKLKKRFSKSWDVITPFEESSIIEGRRWKLAYISIQSIMHGRAARLMTSRGCHFCDIRDFRETKKVIVNVIVIVEKGHKLKTIKQPFENDY